MKRIAIILFALLVEVSAFAQSSLKVEADSAYSKENYQEAAALYENILEQGHSAAIYYNLGNCYYRLEKIGPAVLNYERALLLTPGDSHVRHNLELARNKTLDKITPVGELFIVTWYKGVINWLSVDQWAVLGVCSFVMLLVLISLYLFSKQINLRKVGFYGALCMLLLCIASNIFAWNQKYILMHRNTAVVMVTSASVKSTPSESGTDLFVIHEGTKVTITDPSMNSWKEIRLDDGKSGWIAAESIEGI